MQQGEARMGKQVDPDEIGDQLVQVEHHTGKVGPRHEEVDAACDRHRAHGRFATASEYR